MPDFNELVKNLYTSKKRELTPEKLDYINKNYKGKETDFVKNFYATIGEDLTPEKLDYISTTYLTPQTDPVPKGKASGFPAPNINSPIPDFTKMKATPPSREAALKNKLKNVKVTPENMDQISRETDELSGIIKNNDPNAVAITKQQELQKDPDFLDKYLHFKNNVSSVTDEDKARAQNELNDEVDDNQWTDYLREGSKKLVNNVLKFANTPLEAINRAGGDVPQIPLIDKKNPLEDNLKQADEEFLMIKKAAKANKQPIPVFTKEDRYKRAKELFLKDRTDSYVASRQKDFLQEQNDEDNGALQSKFADFEKGTLASLDEKDKTLLNRQATQEATYIRLQNEIKEIADRAKTEGATPELKQAYEQRVGQYKQLEKEALGTINQYVDNRKNVGNATDNLDIFKRNYGLWENLKGNVASSAQGLVSGAFGAADYAMEAKKRITGQQTPAESDVQETFKNASKDIKDLSENTASKIEKPLSVKNINSFSDFGDWLLNDVTAKQVPIYALLATGGAGVGAIGGTSLGTKFEDMNAEQRNGKQYTTAEMLLHPVGYGLAETASAAVDLMVLKNAGRVIASATAPERRMIAKGMWDKAKDYVGASIKGGVAETLDETGTQGIENLIDGKPFTEGMVDAGAAGGAMGFLIPFISANINQTIKPFTTDNQIQKSAALTAKLQTQLENPALDADTKDIIEENLAKTKSKTQSLIKKTIGNIEKMSDDRFQKIVGLEEDQAKIKAKAEKIQFNDELDPAVKKLLLGNLKEEYKQNNDERLEWLDDNSALNLEEKERKLQEKKDFNDLPVSEFNTFIEQAHESLNDPKASEKAVKDKAFELYQKRNDKPVEKAVPIEKEEDLTQISPNQQEVTETEEVRDPSEISENKEETAPKITVSEVINTPDRTFMYNGEVGSLETEGEQVVFKSPTTIHELGAVKDLSEATLDELGITEESVKINDDNSISINGEIFTNPELEDKGKSIKKDKKGNYLVTLINSKGEKITFRGPKADEIVYKIKLNSNEETAPAQTEPQAEIQEQAEETTVNLPQPAPDTQEKGSEAAVNLPQDKNNIIEYTNAKGEKASLNTDDIEISENKNKFLFTENGNRLGHIQLKPQNGNEVSVALSGLFNPSLYRKGLGTIMYKKLAELLKTKYNLDLVSDTDRTKDSEALWAKLERQGNAVVIGDKSTGKLSDYTYKFIHNESVPGTNTASDENVRPGTTEVGQDGVSEQEADKEESVSDSADNRPNKGKPAESEVNTREQELFDDALNIPFSDEINDFMSGDTIQETDEFEQLDTDQKYQVLKLAEAGIHGQDLIQKAKNAFGENYIDKTLEIIEKLNNAASKTLLTLSLDNDLRDKRAQLSKELKTTKEKAKKEQLKTEILDVTQQINRVQVVRQNLARNTSMALNLNRLGRIMREGNLNPNIEKRVFNKEELETRESIRKSVEITIDDIQKQYEDANAEIDDIISDTSTTASKRKRSSQTIKNDLKSAFADLRKDLLDVAKGKGGLSTSIPYADQIIAATPHIIKISKLLTELGTLKASDIVDKIHTVIKDHIPDVKKEDIASVIEQNAVDTAEEKYQKELDKQIAKVKKAIEDHGKAKPAPKAKLSVWSQELSDLKNQLAELRNETSNARKKVRETLAQTKEALIKAGFGKEISVTKSAVDENGNKVKVKEKRSVLDWKKLLGDKGSVESMKEHIVRILKDDGKSQQEIDSSIEGMNDALKQIRQDITEKALTDLQNRNKIPKTVDVKSETKKLAEAYEQGLFDNDEERYDIVTNRILGFNEFQQEQYDKLKELSKSLAVLFDNRTVMDENKIMSEEALKTQSAIINKQINEIIKKAFRGEKFSKQNIASLIKDYSDMATLSKLLSLKQFFENPFSGVTEQTYQNIGNFVNRDNKLSKDLLDRIKQNSKKVFSDIAFDGSPDYGDSSFSDIQSKKLDEAIRKLKTKKGTTVDVVKNALASIVSGTVYLNAADGYFKSLMTETQFAKTIIDILSNKKYGLDVNMSVEDATKYVSEQLTGKNYDDAVKKAEQIIDKVNTEAGEEILPKTAPNIHRFAMDIVRDNLSSDGFLDEDIVKKAFAASWKAAGSALGHEANNPVSQLYKFTTTGLDQNLKKAIKEKDYVSFVKYTTINIAKNILTPFVSGRFNWAVLAAQKSGANLGLSMLVTKERKNRNKIDFHSEEGLKNLENALHWKMRHDLTVKRSLVGISVNVLALAAIMASGTDDELNEMMDKSKTFKKLFTIFVSPLVSTYLASQGGIDKAIDQILNIYSITDRGERGTATTAFKALFDDTKTDQAKSKASGDLGKVVGSTFDTPLPWRFASDVSNVVKETQGIAPYKTNYNANSFVSGLFQGGMFEAIGLREVIAGPEAENKSKKKPATRGRGGSKRGR